MATINHWLNSREQAFVIWTVVVLVLALVAVPAVRPQLWNLLKLAVSPLLGVMFGLSMLYAAGVAVALARFGLLYPTAPKDVAVWYCGVGIPLLFRASQHQGVTRSLREAIALTGLLTFIVNLYVFPLLLELVIVPLIALAVMMQAVASTKKEFAQVDGMLTGILAAFGPGVLAYALVSTVADPRSLIAADTWEKFFLPLELTASFIPFAAGLAWYTRWDTNRTRRRYLTSTAQ